MQKFQLFGGGIQVRRSKNDVSFVNNRMHCHDKYEILYVLEGVGRCMIEGTEYAIKPRCVLVLPPFAYLSFSLNETSSFESVSIIFDQKHVASSAVDTLLQFGINEGDVSPVAYYNADSVSDQISAIIERFEIIADFPEDNKIKFLELLISELVLLISMSSCAKGRCDDKELGLRVIRYLNENAYRDICLDELARRFFVSKYYLCRAFKKHNGISIHGYINRKRIVYAKQLIESGETASRAAYLVGFGDYSAFYRAYVKIVGKSPTSF